MGNVVNRAVTIGILFGTIAGGVDGYIMHKTFVKAEHFAIKADHLATRLELLNMEHARGKSFAEGYASGLLESYSGALDKPYHRGAISAANEYVAGDNK